MTKKRYYDETGGSLIGVARASGAARDRASPMIYGTKGRAMRLLSLASFFKNAVQKHTQSAQRGVAWRRVGWLTGGKPTTLGRSRLSVVAVGIAAGW